MNDAQMYQQGNTLQKRDALQCLEEYIDKIKWRNDGDTVIDIGCGDGSVTTKILKKKLPNSLKNLVGCDKSVEMVQFANEHYRRDETNFIVLDIESDLPIELKGKFDHAFSFYTLHWIKQQEIAFSNIFYLLAEGGDCLLMFLGHTPIFDVYRILARSSKWSFWLKDVDRFISPYHDSLDPEKEIRRMMTTIGFTNVEVKCTERLFVYDSLECVKKAVTAVNPFDIPDDIYDDFLEDYVKIVKEKYLVDQINNNNVRDSFRVRTDYHLITAYGRK